MANIVYNLIMIEFLIIFGIIVSLSVAAVFSTPRKVKDLYEKYDKIPCSLGVTGGQFAKMALQYIGCKDADVKFNNGFLTDQYIPGKKLIVLSQRVCFGNSVAAIGIAAHEFGHAMQHKNKSLHFRFTQIFSLLSLIAKIFILPVLGFGLYFTLFTLNKVDIGIILLWVSLVLYLSALLFKLILIPAEINASNLAIKFLKQNKAVSASELGKIKKVLKTASLTYVASAIKSVLNPFYLLRH